ncbi:MAG: DEAD/DEAH box helicase [Verrucomicrobia bacterium]|nr:DEAD/DEAH box helicase [Verrucomicrobiota bacterium]
MNPIAPQLEHFTALNQVAVPDLWQQQAVAALRQGKDVIVQAPTGSGKTLIFELWSNHGKNRGQAIYTVPTRALANDKLAEWRSRGWDVGISTGDLSDNLDAHLVVATLETQKNRLIRGDGPSLLVVDEYQMLGDEDRGLNYELALALAPNSTQLLLLSGSVSNPQDIVKWLRRLGRDATLIRHDQRPVPLEEVHANNLNYHVPSEIRNYWPRLVAKALGEDLGPILIFAPRRQAAEQLAAELVRYLPTPNPLSLSLEQKLLVGEHLAKMLKSRVAYHHSGLSYAARAGVIEPLAKAGQLRVVVATMGLAAGINFSLRTVALAGTSYRREFVEQPIKADEILQMFGRAGRRGLDETGFALITANELRLIDAHPCQLSRGGLVDWGVLLNLMTAAHEAGRNPFGEAVRLQERLFTSKPVVLGVENSLKHPNVPCGLKTDPERARHVRRRVREIMNSQGVWEPYPPLAEKPLREIFVQETVVGSPLNGVGSPARGLRLCSILTKPSALEKAGVGQLIALHESQGAETYGRSITVAERISDDRVMITKWARRLTNWPRRQASLDVWNGKIAPLLEKKLAAQSLPLVRFKQAANKMTAEVSLAEQTLRVPVDSAGIALWKPAEREVLPSDCAQCSLVPTCRQLPTSTGVALLWRRLGLVDGSGVPTRRGKIVGFFSHGEGLAIAAALEEESYPVKDLVYDLANLDAGFRFCGEENRWGGRLAMACQRAYGLQTIPAYLENGLPPKYGAGAEQVVASVHQAPQSKNRWITDLVGPGDTDRIIIEWRSLMRRIAHSPEFEWGRWLELQSSAKLILNETESPTLTDLPPLEYHQTRRVDHRLILRRH